MVSLVTRGTLKREARATLKSQLHATVRSAARARGNRRLPSNALNQEATNHPTRARVRGCHTLDKRIKAQGGFASSFFAEERYWEIIADNLSKARMELGLCLSR